MNIELTPLDLDELSLHVEELESLDVQDDFGDIVAGFGVGLAIVGLVAAGFAIGIT